MLVSFTLAVGALLCVRGWAGWPWTVCGNVHGSSPGQPCNKADLTPRGVLVARALDPWRGATTPSGRTAPAGCGPLRLPGPHGCPLVVGLLAPGWGPLGSPRPKWCLQRRASTWPGPAAARVVAEGVLPPTARPGVQKPVAPDYCHLMISLGL